MKNLFTITDNNNTYVLGKYRNNQIIYDFNNTLDYLQAKGKQLFGQHFKLYNEDYETIYKLMIYTIRDKKSCESRDIDLNKGILLTGPVGCGKTTLMQLMPYIAPHLQGYNMYPTRNIVLSFNAGGYDIINTYSIRRTCCFDDLGAEPTGKYYGQDCNVMAEIITARYDLKQQIVPKAIKQTQKAQTPSAKMRLGTVGNQKPKYNRLTHITSNLNADEIENRYGQRVRSRLREMVNVLAFPATTPDKRT